MLVFIASILVGLSGLASVWGGIVLLGVLGTYAGIWVLLSMILDFAVGACLIGAAVIGFLNAANVEKADLLFKVGIGLIALSLVTAVLGFIATVGGYYSFGGLLFGIVYAVGAMIMKKQAAPAA